MRRLACNPDKCPLGLTLDRIWSCPADFKAFSIAPVSLLFYFDWNLLGSALSFLNPLSHILQTQSERESAIYRQLCIIGRKWKQYVFFFRYLVLDLLKGGCCMLLLRQLCLKLFHLNFSFSCLPRSRALFLHINHTIVPPRITHPGTISSIQTKI